jgi:hypothetical protein
MTQVVEHPSTRRKALNSNPSTAKKSFLNEQQMPEDFPVTSLNEPLSAPTNMYRNVCIYFRNFSLPPTLLRYNLHNIELSL